MVLTEWADMGNYDSLDPADQGRKGWLTSILELGAWLGTLLSGFMAETASRKYGILIATCVFILGVVIQATAIRLVHITSLTLVLVLTCPKRRSKLHPRRSLHHWYGSRKSLDDRADVQRRVRST
jgi:MFS family permease